MSRGSTSGRWNDNPLSDSRLTAGDWSRNSEWPVADGFAGKDSDQAAAAMAASMRAAALLHAGPPP